MAKAAADSAGQPLFRYLGGPNAHELPVPMLNVINGGAHADNELEPQEFMLMPVGAASFSEGLRWGVECFQALRDLLHEAGMSTAVGDEGGFAPQVATADDALAFLVRAIDAVGLEPGGEMAIALDPAASEFYKDTRYHLQGADRTAEDMVEFWAHLLDRFPIVSKLPILLFLALPAALPSWAQDKVEFFGGYSYLRASVQVGQFGPLGPGTPCPPNCGTPPRMRSSALSALRPSISASGLRMMRWRMTGGTRSLTSSGTT